MFFKLSTLFHAHDLSLFLREVLIHMVDLLPVPNGVTNFLHNALLYESGNYKIRFAGGVNVFRAIPYRFQI